jgi:Holliday junction resolvase-like predicted endonuclease
MSRPMYETEADRKKEQDLADAFKQQGYDFYKLPMQYRLDFAVFKNGRALAFIEVKHRTCRMHRYTTAMVSLSKVIQARLLTQHTGLPAYLVNVYTDNIARFDFAGHYELREGGRYDRGDSQDADICAYFPVGDATVLRSSKVEWS